MQIYRAMKTNLEVQGFGEKGTKPSMLAFYQSLGLKAHNGVDWAVRCQDNTAKTGGQCENIYFDCDIQGTITDISDDINAGRGYGITTEDKDGIFKHIFWHLDTLNPSLKIGSKVDSGDLLGVGGNTGMSTGAHLHRGLKPMGKDTYGNYYVLNRNNGYDGCTDPMEHFINQYVVDVLNNLEQQVGILQKLLQALKNFYEIIKKTNQ